MGCLVLVMELASLSLKAKSDCLQAMQLWSPEPFIHIVFRVAHDLLDFLPSKGLPWLMLSPSFVTGSVTKNRTKTHFSKVPPS